jgi:hypothetical protein
MTKRIQISGVKSKNAVCAGSRKAGKKKNERQNEITNAFQ